MGQLVDTKPEYYSGQGVLLLALITDGVRGAFEKAGEVPALEASFKIEIDPIKENQTGLSLTDATIEKARDGQIKITFRKFDAAALRRLLRGVIKSGEGGTVSNLALPTGRIKGSIHVLDHANVSDLELVDSASGTPAELTSGVHYRYSPHGSIEFLDVTGFTQPFKASYSYGDVEIVTMMMGQSQRFWLRFEGLNRGHNNDPVLIEYYKVELDVIDKLAHIGDTAENFEINGTLLADLSQDPDGDYGYFGRVVKMVRS